MAENFFGITDKGRQRDKNEDTFIAETISNDLVAACVIDGVGGYAGGEVASNLARSVIREHLLRMSGDILENMKSAIIEANERIHQEKQDSKKNERMACVLTYALADVSNNKFYFAHVGDTRLYLFRDKSLVKITKDHSVVGFLEESGRLTEEEAMRHPKRNEINKALGFDPHIPASSDFIETGESPFLPGDMIILCSDGLSDMIGNTTITSILSNQNDLAGKAKELVDAANSAGGKDNITVVLVENNRVPQKHTPSKPRVKKNETNEPITQENQKERVIIQKKNNTGLVVFLTLLSVALAFALIFNLLKDTAREQALETVQPAVQQRSEKENSLINALNDTVRAFSLSTMGGSTIFISDSVHVKKDSFHLIGNGISLKSDSSYRGPALMISPASKYVLLDSLIIENFEIGIVVQKNNLELKNVRFINCRIPIQYQYMVEDTALVSGKLIDTLIVRTKSAK